MATLKRTYGKKNKVLGRYLVDSIHSAEPSSFDKVQSWKRSNQDRQVSTNLSSVSEVAERSSANSSHTAEMSLNVNAASKTSASVCNMPLGSHSTSKFGARRTNRHSGCSEIPRQHSNIELKRSRSEPDAMSDENTPFQPRTLPSSSSPKMLLMKTDERLYKPSMNQSKNEAKIAGLKDYYQALKYCNGSDNDNTGELAASLNTLPSKHCQIPTESTFELSSELSNTTKAGGQSQANDNIKRSNVSETSDKTKAKKIRPSYPSLPLCSLQTLFKLPR